MNLNGKTPLEIAIRLSHTSLIPLLGDQKKIRSTSRNNPPSGKTATTKPTTAISLRMKEVVSQCVGLPLTIFPADYKLPNISVHEAVDKAMVSAWDEKMRKDYCNFMKEFLNNSEKIKALRKEHDLTEDEAGAIAYYTSDIRTVLNSAIPSTQNLYSVLNNLMGKRSTSALENWKPYILLLITGLMKLPNYQGQVFRALRVPLLASSSQYKVGATVVWISFSSTSRSKSELKSFDNGDTGSWLILSVVEGKDISGFSLFEGEEEVILLPNAYFKVEAILSQETKKLLGLSTTIDVLELTQTPTPHLLRSFFSPI